MEVEERRSVLPSEEPHFPFAMTSTSLSSGFSSTSCEPRSNHPPSPAVTMQATDTSFLSQHSPLSHTESSFSCGGASAPPLLTSSITSTPTTAVDSASSFLDYTGDSSMLDAAASLLLPHLSTDSVERSTLSSNVFSLPMRSVGVRTGSGAPVGRSDPTEGYSQLLNAASVPTEPLLPSLPEEEEEYAVAPSTEPPSFSDTATGSSFVSARAWGSSQTGNHGYVPPSVPLLPSVNPDDTLLGGQTIVPPATTWRRRRTTIPLASLAGATARQTSPHRFCVEIEVHVENAEAALAQLMQLWRDPSKLCQWCDLMPSDATILTMYTQGTAETSGTGCDRLDYEGEWTKATTAASLLPPKSSCWYACQQAWWRMWGLADYTSVKIFAEPVRRSVSVKLGPLPGNSTLEQQLTVDVISAHKLRLVNKVQLESEALSSLWSSVSGNPSLQDYMDQTLRSMARLRFWVEQQSSQIGNAVV